MTTTLADLPAIEHQIKTAFTSGAVRPARMIVLYCDSDGTPCGCAVGAYLTTRSVTPSAWFAALNDDDREEEDLYIVAARLADLEPVNVEALSDGYEGLGLRVGVLARATDLDVTRAFWETGRRLATFAHTLRERERATLPDHATLEPFVAQDRMTAHQEMPV